MRWIAADPLYGFSRFTSSLMIRRHAAFTLPMVMVGLCIISKSVARLFKSSADLYYNALQKRAASAAAATKAVDTVAMISSPRGAND